MTPASNPGREEPEAGLSRLEHGGLLRDAIAADPAAWLGRRHVERFGASTGLLVKLLDAAERLPVHAHPDDAFAAARLGSAFGKTEAWVIVDTREPEAEVWVGQREPVDPDEYRRWIDSQDVEHLLGSLNRIAVRRGDVIYVPGGVPHAIGAGVLMVELQQPTDFSLVCEWTGFPIRPEEAHLGLGWESALAALDLGAHTPIRSLPEEARRYFWVDDEVGAAGRFAILVVLDGEGEIDGMAARRGDCFAVPAAVDRLEAEGTLQVLRCLAPSNE